MRMILVVFAFFTNYLFAFEIANLSDAINLSGKQRMLTQRMLKDYAMVGMKNKFGNPKEDLQKMMNSFDKALEELNSFNKDETTSKALNKEQKLWEKVSSLLKQDPTKKDAKKLKTMLEDLLKIANEATVDFTKQSKKTSAQIVNISGRQRMLSQKMASLYMLRVWGVDDKNFSKKMNEAMELFDSSHKKLKDYKENTPQINALLKKVENSFSFFKIMSRSKSRFIPTLIYKKSNDILKNMDEITHLYIKLEER